MKGLEVRVPGYGGLVVGVLVEKGPYVTIQSQVHRIRPLPTEIVNFEGLK